MTEADRKKQVDQQIDQLATWLKAKPEAVLAITTLAKGYGFKPASTKATPGKG